MQALLPFITDGRRVVNLSSGLTKPCFPGYAAYAAVKDAVEVLTRFPAKELGARSMAVNTVARRDRDGFGGGGDLAINERFADMTAPSRAGVPDDIGPIIAGLLGQHNR